MNNTPQSQDKGGNQRPAQGQTTSRQTPAPAGVQQRPFQRRKVCYFCQEKIETIDYKNVKQLRRFVTERGKIIPRRVSGTCSSHQRQLSQAIKRARNIALLPFKAK
ncbi:MAG: 30S ribosomal protein S18 [Candidatus Sumerlaeia bacterium]|nr:30S ribosomal protein S18 [Candidatus Sumerlaeia bacterium]